MIKTHQNHPGWLLFGGEIRIILRKSDEAMASSASVVDTVMNNLYIIVVLSFFQVCDPAAARLSFDNDFYLSFANSTNIWFLSMDHPEDIIDGDYHSVTDANEYYPSLAGKSIDAMFKYDGEIFVITGKYCFVASNASMMLMKYFVFLGICIYMCVLQ